MKALWIFTKILLTIAGSIGILLMQGYEDKKANEKIPCKHLGLTKVEYGVWVSNCGDTVLMEEMSDKLKRYNDKYKSKKDQSEDEW